MHNPPPLIRPRMPTPDDEARSVHTRQREAVLLEEWDDTLGDYMESHVSAQRLEKWGPPDTSANPLADISRQLSTPGLYGQRPVVRHSHPRNDGLIGVGGALDAAGSWVKSQFVQYLALGAGDWLVRPGVDPITGEAMERLVSPADVFVVPQAHRPDRWAQLWELRLRYWEERSDWVYAWDVYDITDPGSPSLRVVEAKLGGGLGQDLSNVFLPGEEGWPAIYRYASGAPFIPFVRYKWADTGRTWNTFLRRGTLRGTLNAAMYATFTGRSALDATGTAVLIFNASPPVGNVTAAGQPGSHRTLELEPGAALFLQAEGEQQPSAVQVGPGANLPVLAAFVSQYSASLAAAYGLNASDLQRVSADPTSGFALFVSQAGKRQVQRQVRPLFEASDIERIGMHAAMQTAAGFGPYDERGYSISYHEIEDSPQEQRAHREDLDWRVERGFMSPLDAYQALNPGTTRDDALRAMRQAAADRQALQAGDDTTTTDTTTDTTTEE